MPVYSTPDTAQQARTIIVVPAYNEAARFDTSSLDEFLASHSNVDFILVNDGSKDETLALFERQRDKWPTRIEVLDLQPNRGKSEAVRQGMLLAADSSSVNYIGFWDADWATPLAAIDSFVRQLDIDASVMLAIGSRVRLLGRDIDRKPLRHYVGRIAATMASMVLGIAVYDTQCGAKLLRANVLTRGLFSAPFGSRWVFDVELIARYLKAHPNGTGIYELPLDHWRDVGDSKVRTRDVFGAFAELLRIHRRYRLSKGVGWLLDIASSLFLRQALLGMAGTLLQYLCLVFAVEVIALAPPIAAVASAALGALVNYLLALHVIVPCLNGLRFSSRRALALGVVSLVAAYAMAAWGSRALGLHYVMAQLVATVLVFGLGLIAHRRRSA